MYERVLVMNLHSLRLFHEIARKGSVTQAATQLNISQPAVTAQIKKFERDHNIKLIEAAGRGVKLTAFGQKIYQQTARLFAVETEIEELVAYEQGVNEHDLRIGGNYLTMRFILPQVIETFKSEHPKTTVKLTTLNTAETLDELTKGSLDLALLGSGVENQPLINKQQIYEDRLCFVSAPSHPLASQHAELADLSNELFVGRESSSFTQQALLSLFNDKGLALPEFMVTHNNSRDALEAVIEQKGIYYCSYLMVSQELAEGKLVELSVKSVNKPHPIYVCWRQGAPLSLASRQFRDSLFEQLN